jgi:hypothetical protein
MTLDTTLDTEGPIDLEELRAFCAQQLGIGPDMEWITECVLPLLDKMLTTPVERSTGGAHLAINYIPTSDDPTMVRYVEVTWITGWGSVSPAGEKPVPFHSRLAAELGTWLIERGLMVEVCWHS